VQIGLSCLPHPLEIDCSRQAKLSFHPFPSSRKRPADLRPIEKVIPGLDPRDTPSRAESLGFTSESASYDYSSRHSNGGDRGGGGA
jgi:hypothetical protein